MGKNLLFVAMGASLLGSVAAGYEWWSHNRMAWNARDVFLGQAATHKPPYALEGPRQDVADFLGFLEKHGLTDLDTRAGDDHEAWLPWLGTDEDSMEGKLLEWGMSGEFCDFPESTCGLVCTKDHFHPRLTLPLAGKDAVDHAQEYFDMAVKFYKAAKCDRVGMEETYKKWAARALGHAIHLVEDMGSPQHAKPENHMPFPLGHGWSFHETWPLDLCGEPLRYVWSDTGACVLMGRFEAAGAFRNGPSPRLTWGFGHGECCRRI